MSEPFDEWLTCKPDEELCDEHSRPRPCMVCRMNYWEARAEAQREERRP